MADKKSNLPSWANDPLCQRYVVLLYSRFVKLDGEGRAIGRNHWRDISQRMSDVAGIFIDREEIKRHAADIKSWTDNHSKEEELDEEELRKMLWAKYPHLRQTRLGSSPQFREIVQVDEDSDYESPKPASKPKSTKPPKVSCVSSAHSATADRAEESSQNKDLVNMGQLGLTWLQQIADSSRRIASSLDKIASRLSGNESFALAASAAQTVIKAKLADSSGSQLQSNQPTTPSSRKLSRSSSASRQSETKATTSSRKSASSPSSSSQASTAADSVQCESPLTPSAHKRTHTQLVDVDSSSDDQDAAGDNEENDSLEAHDAIMNGGSFLAKAARHIARMGAKRQVATDASANQ